MWDSDSEAEAGSDPFQFIAKVLFNERVDGRDKMKGLSSLPLFRPVEYLDFSRLLSNTFHTHSDSHELLSIHTIFVLTGSLRTYMFGRSD